MYLQFYYDLGALSPEEMDYAAILPAVLEELDTGRHTAIELNTLRNTCVGESTVTTNIWTGRQAGAPCIAKLTARQPAGNATWTKPWSCWASCCMRRNCPSPQAEAAFAQTLDQLKLNYEQDFIANGHNHAILRPAGASRPRWP